MSDSYGSDILGQLRDIKEILLRIEQRMQTS